MKGDRRSRAPREKREDEAQHAIEAGEKLLAEGDYAAALVQLGEARRAVEGDERIRVELDLGIALLLRGQIDRAIAHLEFAAEGEGRWQGAALAHLGEALRLRQSHGPAREALERARKLLDGEPADALARTLASLAQLALAGDEIDRAEALAKESHALAKKRAPAAQSIALLALAETRRRRGDEAGAERFCKLAIHAAAAFREGRELAEAYFAYALALADCDDPEEDEPPAAWLARALELYREHGSIGDVERVRHAFRVHGRRATDRIGSPAVQELVETMRVSRQKLAETAYRVVEELRRRGVEAVDVELGTALEASSAAEARLVSALQAILVERENIRTLLDVCRSLNALGDYQRLVIEIGKMAAQLTGADRALVALSEGGLRAAARVAIAEDDDAWLPIVKTALDEGAPFLVEDAAPRGGDGGLRRDTTTRLGRAMATPLRLGDRVFGAVYVDKELGGGVFTPRELDLLAIFCAQASTMLANVEAAERLRLAARSRAATLEAISDGVLTFDHEGRVDAINTAARAILGVGPARLGDHPELAFLRSTVERGEELVGRVVRLGAGEYVVNARVIRSDTGGIVGGVATLTEMKRAQSIARRIVVSPARYSFGDLIGRSATLSRELQLAQAAARSDSSVLITGESGTGKEVLTQAIHNGSARAGGPFVGINCSAIPRELLESELFGYEAGAFTGARRGGQPGKFELADGGTILLDEVGDMPLEMQAKLLRVLQERRVARVGGSREVVLDVRIIATTNRDLDEAVARGHFRADLLFRLKVIHIRLPPLRERAGDIPVLVLHFLSLFAARLGKQLVEVAPPVMEALVAYRWPGNIRELENVLEAEVNLVDPERRVLDEIPDALLPRGSSSPGIAFSLTLDEAERELLVAALQRHNGSVPEVARALGVSRGTVYNKLRRYALDADHYRTK